MPEEEIESGLATVEPDEQPATIEAQETKQSPVNLEDFQKGRAGDTEAMDRFLNQVLRYAQRVAATFVDRHEAEDIGGETVIKVLEKLDTFQKTDSEAALKTWIATIAANLARDRLRNIARKPVWTAGLPEHQEEKDTLSYTASLTEPDIADQVIKSLDNPDARVRQAVQSLSPDHRRVIELHYFDDNKIEEVAKKMGIQVGTVKSKLARAREALARKLAGPLGIPKQPKTIRVQRERKLREPSAAEPLLDQETQPEDLN